MLALAVWALASLAWGERFDALLLLAFFIFLRLVRPRHLAQITVPILFVVLLFTPALQTLVAVGQSNLSISQHFDAKLHEILTRNSGEEALPFEVQQMLYLLRARHLKSYRVSPQIWQDFEQRVVEGLWPARLDLSSPNMFRLNTDTSLASCSAVRERGNVVLEHCR